MCTANTKGELLLIQVLSLVCSHFYKASIRLFYAMWLWHALLLPEGIKNYYPLKRLTILNLEAYKNWNLENCCYIIIVIAIKFPFTIIILRILSMKRFEVLINVNKNGHQITYLVRFPFTISSYSTYIVLSTGSSD